MYVMSNRFLKEYIDGVRVPQSQLSYICDTTNSLHKNLVEFFSLITLYVVGRSILGTSIMGVLHKVK